MSAPRVGVVVVNWNNLADTLECLASLAASRYPAISTVLVDNGSTEDPSGVVSARYPNVHIIRQPRNLGYSGGNNAGIVWALENGADYVLLLNNDAIADAGMIEELVLVAERYPDAGFVTPRIFIHGTEEIYWDGGNVDWTNGDVSHDSSSLLKRDCALESGWSNGCAPLVRANTIREIGLMDGELFLYYEDVDWSARASRGGWRHLVAVNGKCWHKVSRSSGGVTTPLARYYHARNRYRVLARYSAAYESVPGIVRYAARILADYHRHRQDVPARRAILHGALDLLSGRWGQRGQPSPAFIGVCDGCVYLLAATAFVLVRGWRLVSELKRLLFDAGRLK